MSYTRPITEIGESSFIDPNMTFGEISDWLREAGFKNIRKLEAQGPSPLILADKP